MIRRVGTRAALLTAIAWLTGCAQPAPPLVGAWRSQVRFESGAFAAMQDLEFMYVFNAGGTMTESSNYDAAPPVPPAYGIWRQTGTNAYTAKYEYYATQPTEPAQFEKGAGWLPAGHGVLTETITLADDGKSYTATMRFDLFDAKGQPAEGGGTAKVQGVRIGF
jgi:hypothetical protein